MTQDLVQEHCPTPQPGGERFGRFTLLECIGRGGMAEVFRAVAEGVEGFRRIFVVKRILKDKSANPALVEMFVKEARISALLNHPNIVQIYDFGQIQGRYFLSMEYLRGKDLLLVLRQLRSSDRIMPPAVAAFVAREVGAGLAYAHHLSHQGGKSLNIVHRDVSPSNVMLLRTGGVKLLDFGIAKAEMLLDTDEFGHNTQTGLVKGKLSYLSPEQIRNEPIDGRSDVFSLGVVLWECLTGKRLFHDRVDYQTMNNVLERPIPPPSTLRPGIGPGLDFIVVRALERSPDQRYQSARAMVQDLEHYLSEARFSAGSLPALLDQLFGTDAMEVESLPARAPAAAPEENDVNEANEVQEISFALPSRSSSAAFPAISRSSDSMIAARARKQGAAWVRRSWPWIAGAALTAGAFSAGLMVKHPDRPSLNRPSTNEQTEHRAPSVQTSAATNDRPPNPGVGSVSVRIESDPTGAQVHKQDGGLLGVTPLNTRLPRSTMPTPLTISKDGFQTSQHTVIPDRDLAAYVGMRPLPHSEDENRPARASSP